MVPLVQQSYFVVAPSSHQFLDNLDARFIWYQCDNTENSRLEKWLCFSTFCKPADMLVESRLCFRGHPQWHLLIPAVWNP